jgi:hypothetical protein
MSAVGHWGQFARERFPPATHLPMVALFALANAGVAAPEWQLRLTLAAAVTLSFFFRLRLFDEIKDFAVDRAVNPERPLARGMLHVRELQLVSAGLAVGELALCATLSSAAAGTHAVAVAYSLLMYREFFIGQWLRRHLATYAVTHTIVTVPVGWSVMAQVSGLAVWEFPPAWIGAALVNWMLFNVFEFSRKTFAPSEERANVDSYSRLFTPFGAAVLTLSQVALAVLLLGSPTSQIGLAAIPVLAAAVFLVWGSPPVARLFRAASSAYILAFYALLAWQRWHL